MFSYIGTSDILERAEVIFLNTANQLKKTLLSTDLPKVMILQNRNYNTHTKYLNNIVNRSLCIKAEVFTSNSLEETSELLNKVANGDYIVYFDPPTITSVPDHVRDDWNYNPDIDGILGSYRLNNVVNNSLNQWTVCFF